jgi:hypothetical protein
MATTSFIALRRSAGITITLLLLSVCLCERAAGQQGASPLVTSSVAYGLQAPPTTGPFWQTAVSSHGDFVVSDFQNAAIYQYPAGGGPMITIFPKGKSGPGDGWANPGIAIDKYDNLLVDNNWNGGLQIIPYNPATKTWNTAANKTINPISALTGYFQGTGLAANANGTFVMSSECCSPSILSWTQDQFGNSSNVQTVINSATSRARSLAIDNAGNIFIWEDGGLPSVVEVPAGTVNLANDKGLPALIPTTIDPTSGKAEDLLQSITGVAVDAAGNLYIGDSSVGVVMVPNQGGTLNPAAWVLITPVPAQGQISIDQARDTLYIPTNSVWNGLKYFAAVSLGNGELGSSAVGATSATPITVYYSFSGPVTPARFIIQEDGVATPDFAVVSGGSCTTGTTYPIPATASTNGVTYCTVNVAVNPHIAGAVSGQLLLQTAATVNKQTVYTTVATTALHGTGLAGAVATTPAWESAVGFGLTTPGQVATDTMGNVYVADAGHVLGYPPGSNGSANPVLVADGFAATPGLAVDGTGDVFVADSGNVYEILYPQTVWLPAGTIGSPINMVTLATGLGANLQLAADGLGHVYVADPQNGRVVELSNPGGLLGAFGESETFLTNGFTAPSAVAVDSSNNLYVVDGSNLFELSNGSLTTLMNTLSGVTGIAVDPSGAVYVSSSSGTVRIPSVSGVLNPANQTAIAAAVTNPMSVALDTMGNVYLADGTANNVHMVSTNGSLNFGNVPLGDQPSLNATITNTGNAPLTITGYTSTNAVDYTGSDVSCVSGSPLAPAATCQMTVTLAPGPGEQGTLTGQIGIQSNGANSPIVVNTTAVSAPLAVSVVSGISVASSAEVINTPVTVTVTPKAGSTVPTGTVTISVNGTQMGTGKLVGGVYTFTLAPVPAGTDTFSVAYSGDRVYGRSTGTTTAVVAKSAVSAIKMPTNPAPPTYVLEGNGSTPYDGSADYWEYNFKVQVAAAAGIPTGSVTFMDSYQAGSTATLTSGIACPAQSNAAIQPVDPSGYATFSTSCLPMPQNLTYTPVVSTHVITPVYSGDANYLTYTGTPTTFIVVRSPVVAITSSASSLSLSAGSTASANLTLTSMLGYGFAGKNQQLNDYNFPVSLACDNLPPHANCTFTYAPDPALASFGLSATSPTAVNILCSGTTAAADNCAPGLPVTVTINTNVPVGTTSQLAQPAPFAFAAMFGCGMVGLFFRRRIGQKGRLMLMVCLMVLGGLLAGSLTACSTTNLSPASVLTTPKGTYAVTITAQQVGTQVITLPTGPITIYGSENQVSLPFTLNVTVQ